MSDNEMDDIIRKAAGEYHPPYNDKSWQRMEQLLGKHLPVEKERNYRVLYLLLLLLFIGGGTYFGISYFSSEKKSPSSVANNSSTNQSKNSSPISNSTLPNSENNSTATSSGNENSISSNNLINGNSTLKSSSVNNNSTDSRPLFTNSNGKNSRKAKTISLRNKIKVSITNVRADKGVVNNDDNNGGEVIKNEEISNNNKNAEIAVNSDTQKDNNIKKKEEAKKDEPKKDTTPGQVTKAKIKKEEKNNFRNSLGVSFSIGPDVSFVRVKDMGTVSANYGVGLSYKLSKHFTIQSGFYTSNKIYTADSADYHPPKQFQAYYPYLDKIYANCNIYEIPVQVTYNFKSSGKHNWFVSTGLSSILMHTETYRYEYDRYGAGQVISRPYTIKNKNQHCFSVLTLAGGYEYELNKKISINLSPYIKVPLAGVGYGKVKLNSTGMLLTITAKPFAKK
jgi:hypothetical protein